MREKEFRVYDKKRKKMIENTDNTIYYFCVCGDVVVKVIYEYQGVWNPISCTQLTWEEINNLIIMQYVGVTDNKDIKIFEDDIVEGTDSFGRYFKGVVVYESGVYYIKSKDQNRPIKIYNIVTIIGNMHNKPELLNS